MTDLVAVGAGRMGRGIALVAAMAGQDIVLLDFKARNTDTQHSLLDAARAEISDTLDLLIGLSVLSETAKPDIIGRISFASLQQAPQHLATAKIIFEGVPETLEAKKDAFNRVSEMVTEDCVISSTTSTILADDLAAFVTRPERFLNGHWLNPAYLIPLVEVSPADQTSQQTVDHFIEVLQSLGKSPVLCSASPGYIIPRIQAVAMNEAARMVEEGVATPEDIDRAVRLGFGIRYATMGLVEFIDWGGVDILYRASDYLSDALKDPRYAAPDIVNEKMQAGDLGLNHGKGFYDFSNIDPTAFRQEKLATFVALLKHMDLLPKIAD